MLVKKGIRLRLYPNKGQSIQLNKTLDCCRFLYNKLLEEHIRFYAQLKDDKDSLYDYTYKTENNYKQGYPFLKKVDAKALQTENRHFFDAYQNFFEGLKTGREVGFPRFKSKKSTHRPTSPTISTTAYGLTTSEKSCGTTHYRDNNSVVNIKREGIKILQEEIGIAVYHHDTSTVGTTGSQASREDVRPPIPLPSSSHGKRNPLAFRLW